MEKYLKPQHKIVTTKFTLLHHQNIGSLHPEKDQTFWIYLYLKFPTVFTHLQLISTKFAMIIQLSSWKLTLPLLLNPNLILGQMDWEKFRSSLDSQCNLKTSLKSPNDIDEAVHLLTKSIQETAWSCSLPMQTTNPTRNLPLDIRILISDKRKARATWQRTKYPLDKIKLNN